MVGLLCTVWTPIKLLYCETGVWNVSSKELQLRRVRSQLFRSNYSELWIFKGDRWMVRLTQTLEFP
jgi:hypothetical protein